MNLTLLGVQRRVITPDQLRLLGYWGEVEWTRRGVLYEDIKFLYWLTFPGLRVIYVGSGGYQRVLGRLRGKVLPGDSSRLTRFTSRASVMGIPRIVTVVAMHITKGSWDPGPDVECYEKQKWIKRGWVLLNRYDNRPTRTPYDVIPFDGWRGGETQEFYELAYSRRRWKRTA